jgi:hypothetical protein
MSKAPDATRRPCTRMAAAGALADPSDAERRQDSGLGSEVSHA